MKKFLGLFILLGSLPIGARAEDDAWKNPPEKMTDTFFMKEFRKHVVDFDEVSSDDLGYQVQWCRLVQLVPPPANAPAGALPTRKIVLSSRFLTNCMFERMRAGMADHTYQGFIEAEIKMQGPPYNDFIRYMKMDWRPVEISDPHPGFWARFSRFVSTPVALINWYSVARDFMNSFMSADIYIDFDKPVQLSQFDVPSWVIPLGVGDPTKTAITHLEFHTAELEVTPDNPYRMHALMIGRNAEKEKQIFLDLKFNWGIFHQKHLQLDLSGH